MKGSAILPSLIKTRTCGIDTLMDRTLEYGNALINDVFTAHVSLYRILIGRDTHRSPCREIRRCPNNVFVFDRCSFARKLRYRPSLEIAHAICGRLL